ncbi:MAG TPA: DUF1553 domain-containing protein [Puia sp.]
MLLLAILSWLFFFHEHPVDFNTQVKPILNKKCIVCHGGVKRQGDFSLLFRSDALTKAKSGKLPIIPGDPDHSEMIRRINLHDPEDRMPYKQPPLTNEEIGVLHDWIKQGAKWGDHWAYVPVKAPSSADGIDDYIHEKWKEQGLSGSPEALKAVLLRRVCLDVTGLPPTPQQADAFLRDTRPDAYERLVDSLLASRRYGEKWAALWLDLARYADTKGYERDAGRDIWRYRDWLINAFNADMPYDQFLTQQLAGDLLPHPTDAELIATAFHRNTMTNDEGGTDNEEFRTAAVLDRVNTTWQALMGTTFACVQCHSHPYDPFRHDEYYQFMAFFNDSRDEDTYADYPLLRQFSPGDSLDIVKLSNWVGRKGSLDQGKEVAWFLRTWEPSINSIRADEFVNSELNDTKWLIFRNHAVARLPDVDLDQRDQLIYRFAGYLGGGVLTMHLDRPDGPVLQTIHVGKTKDWAIDVVNFPLQRGKHDLFFTYENPQLKGPNASGMEFDWFHFTRSLPGVGDPEYAGMKKIYDTLMRRNVPTTPVMVDNPGDMHRATHVFEKGNWLVKGKVVEAGTPRSLNPFPAGAPRNRLGLAMWLTSPKNPLTARTMVNRVWEQLFGTGLVETLEDLGTQGAEPTHRELMDYLAWKFMTDDKWSIKTLVRSIVLSATYREDSKVSPEELQKDPDNKYYARGARVRLSAEQIRDQALAVSGLLVEKLGGPSVMPWQPKGIWLSPWNGQDWSKSKGSDQYRRALYTYWKRTAPYPSMMSFDGTARELCTARRIRTNTPLQALTLLNDSVYLDASRHLAAMMERTGSPKEAIRNGYAAVVYHPIDDVSLKVLEGLYDTSYKRYSHSSEKTRELAGSDGAYDKPSNAAMIVVANAILNLDEVITKN